MWINIHTHSGRMSADAIEVYNVDMASAESFSQTKSLVLSVGLHPYHCMLWSEHMKQQMHALLKGKNVAFVGEIGLDASIDVAMDVQNSVFSEQLSLASSNSLPVILHVVKSYDGLLQIKKQFDRIPGWIIHGFRGKPELLKQLLNQGFYISFGVKFNEDSLKECPLNRLFLETDVMEMPLMELYRKVALIKGCPEETLKEAIYSNYKVITGNNKGVNHEM